MKKWIIFLVAMSIIGCADNEKEQVIQGILPDTVPDEIVITSIDTLITGNIRNNSENAFISDDFLNIFQPHHYRYFEVILPNNTSLYTVDGDETTAIESIPVGTSVRIIAQNNSDSNPYFLVKINGDSNMWSGWIRGESIARDVRENIPSIGGPGRRFLHTLPQNVSTRNDILITRWADDIIVVKRSGKIAYRISVEELFDPGTDASVLRWTTDETKVWLDFFEGPTPFKFGILDINTGEITLLNPPPSFDSGSVPALDPDTGDMWYSDYPIHFDVFGAQMTRESGRTFHLFAFNFFTEERRIVDTNIGEGFFISFDKNNGFTFERLNLFSDE